jgi:hypothetical protein
VTARIATTRNIGGSVPRRTPRSRSAVECDEAASGICGAHSAPGAPSSHHVRARSHRRARDLVIFVDLDAPNGTRAQCSVRTNVQIAGSQIGCA